MKRKIRILLLLLFIVILTGCQQDELEDIEHYNEGPKITGLSKDVYKYGDTISVYGVNFGNERAGKYIEFQYLQEGSVTSLTAEEYILWSDTLLMLVVPEGIDKGKIIIKGTLSNTYDIEIAKPFWLKVIDFLILASLFATAVYVYLRINKIWKRKHDKEVAESQSLTGLTILILNCILWGLYYTFVTFDQKSLLDTTFYLFEASLFFIIGTGVFVKGQRSTGFWKLVKQSLKLERKEANYLLKRFFKPKHADIIIDILHQLAMIDDELDEKEQEIITLFAKEWNIEYSAEKLNRARVAGTEDNYVRLRNSVQSYLGQEPPREQVAMLKDMIDALINADDKVTEEEALIADELLPSIEAYINQETIFRKYHVIVVPQKPEHEHRIVELLPDSVRIETAGGIAYSMGTFFSIKYAEMICKQFRQQKLFTIVYSLDDSLENNGNGS